VPCPGNKSSLRYSEPDLNGKNYITIVADKREIEYKNIEEALI